MCECDFSLFDRRCCHVIASIEWTPIPYEKKNTSAIQKSNEILFSKCVHSEAFFCESGVKIAVKCEYCFSFFMLNDLSESVLGIRIYWSLESHWHPDDSVQYRKLSDSCAQFLLQIDSNPIREYFDVSILAFNYRNKFKYHVWKHRQCISSRLLKNIDI